MIEKILYFIVALFLIVLFTDFLLVYPKWVYIILSILLIIFGCIDTLTKN